MVYFAYAHKLFTAAESAMKCLWSITWSRRSYKTHAPSQLFYPPKRQGPKRYSPIKGKNRPQRDSVRMLVCVRFACSNLSYFSTPFWLIPLHILALCQVLCLLIIDLSSAYFNCRFWRDRCDAINHHSSLVSWKVGQSKSFLRQKLRWSKPLTQNYRPLKHKNIKVRLSTSLKLLM